MILTQLKLTKSYRKNNKILTNSTIRNLADEIKRLEQIQMIQKNEKKIEKSRKR